MSFVSWNVTGLNSILNGVLYSRSDFIKFTEKFDVLCLTETWANVNDNFQIPGFVEHSVIRKKHRKAKKNSGGISVYVANYLSEYISRIKSQSRNILWLHLKLKSAKAGYNIVLGTVYISPEGSPVHAEENTFQIMYNEIINLKIKYADAKFVVVGDYNAYTACNKDYIDTSLDRWDSFQENEPFIELPQRRNLDTRDVNKHGRELLSFCMNTDMCIANGRVGFDKQGGFTCFFGKFPSTVDYVICDRELLIQFSDFYIANRIESHHLPICCAIETSAELDQKVQTNYHCDLMRYRMKDDLTPAFIEKFLEHNLREILALVNNNHLEDAVSLFNTYLTDSANNMAEKRLSKISPKPREPWFDQQCESLKNVCINKLRKYRKRRNPDTLIQFKDAKKLFREVYKQKRSSYKNKERVDLINNLSSKNSKDFWQLVRKKTKRAVGMGNISLPKWANYFKELFVNPYTLLDFNLEQRDGVENAILDNEITLIEVTKAIDGLKSNKAPGVDGITAEFYKVLKPYVSEYITCIFNALYKNAYFPLAWTKALIIPIPKKGDLNKPENYRGISLLPIFSKIYTHIIKERLLKWCVLEDKICCEQAGFRKHFSTLDNVFVIDTLIGKCLRKKGGRFYLAFIDFSRAFDSVNHKALWHKLIKLDISSNMLSMLMNIYEKVYASVLSDKGVSNAFECSIGVKQGCVLSPILFSLFVNDLPEELHQDELNRVSLMSKELNCLLFADDVVMLAESPHGLQKQLNALERYCNKWCLKVNIDKSKIMVCRNGGKLRNYEKWFFKSQQVDVCTYYPYLGVVFSCVHSWTQNQKLRAERADKALFSIKRLLAQFDVTDSNLAFKLFDTKILPILHYGSEIWGFHEAKEVERVQVNFCKNILRLHRNTPDIAARGELGRLPLRTNRYTNIINFWLRLLSHDNNRLTKQAYELQLKWVETDTDCWLLRVKRLLMTHGFGEVWFNQGPGNDIVFKSEFKNRCRDIEIQNWCTAIQDMDRLRYYKIFKNVIDKESYIDRVKKDDIAVLSNFRCNSLPLRCLTGYLYEKLQYHNCTCQLCNTGEIEDEYHFFLRCPAYSRIRIDILPRFLCINPSKHKFSEFLRIQTEANLQITIKYLKAALKLRSKRTEI